jgi:uroporphyrinogen III methyltransferase/synthase
MQVLQRADLILYDKLAPHSLLDYAKPGAEIRSVVDLAAHHPERVLPIHDTMIEAAKRGQCVVRLKGGDPSIFGRGGEEAQALREAEIPFEIVPGVTAALGAAAFAGIPLTHRAYCSAVAFVTGHENPAKPETALDWAALAKFPGTLVLYMGMSRLDRLVAHLVEHGKSPQTPAAVVRVATTGDQQTVESTLEELPNAVRLAGLAAPALVIVGEVVRLRQEVAWFEHLPLFNKRILVTRPQTQSAELAAQIIERGGHPYLLPAVEIRDPADWEPVDRAIAEIEQYQWLVFTSVHGVEYFLQRLRSVGRDLRALGHIKLAAIGPKTADALRRRGLDPDLVPQRYQSEDLAAALQQAIRPGDRILLARADRGREILRESLAATNEVVQIAVYSQVDAANVDQELIDHLRRGEIDFITLTSSNIARSLVKQLDETCLERIRQGHIHLVTLSPVTSEAVRELGLPIAAEAEEATMEGLLHALERLL